MIFDAMSDEEWAIFDEFHFFCRFALLIVDEDRIPARHPRRRQPFFQLVNARYERGAMILTSNRGFAERGDVFGDPVVATALLDCLLRHASAVQIEGAKYRVGHHADLGTHPVEGHDPGPANRTPTPARPIAQIRSRRPEPQLIKSTLDAKPGPFRLSDGSTA
ncbi:ATP-binding protein [Segnochrobactrum spirostomi]|uniref:ATP-binding protein n=1 Tax=Segnochrobactrum spirostomi TaxID=2608987 RepID=UPI001AD84885|nr:ATP-binding protein [Segnochrobactrum spirostomi]